jgi:hypothetical protein
MVDSPADQAWPDSPATSAGLTGPAGVNPAALAGPDGGAPTQVTADLVVDATGRGSRTPVWLAELGYQSPEQERVEVGQGYATRTYRLRPGAMDGDQLILTAGTPANPRAGFLAATEGAATC